MKQFFYLAIIFGLVACSDSFDSDKETLLDISNNPYSISITDAERIAAAYFIDSGVIPNTRSGNLYVKDSFSIKSRSEEPLLHVFNYEGGGFAIISADNRLHPIQAYSSVGFFRNDIENYPLGLKIWIDSTEDALEEAKQKGVEADDDIKMAWMIYQTNGLYGCGIKTRSLTPGEMPSEEVDTLVGPFITDRWHQNSPYNDNLSDGAHYYPYDFYDNNGLLHNAGDYAGSYHPVVGCVPLAIARVLRYHQIPNSYSWSSMPNSAPQTAATKSFISDIHYAIKSYVDNIGSGLFKYFRYPDWNNSLTYITGYHNETGVYKQFSIGSFLCDQYNLPAAITESYSVNSHGLIRREIIDYHLPCIISGSTAAGAGHAWICDGYHYNFIPVFDLNGEQIGGIRTIRLHYCWGMENCEYDGWYNSNNVTMGNYTLQYQMTVTHYISELNYWELF